MDTDELKVLIALAGRLPHLEEEIFTDLDLTEIYLNTLDASNSEIQAKIYCYARHKIQGRWALAEQVFLRDSTPEWAYYYAHNIIRGRWPEAEHIIFADPVFKQYYVEEFLNLSE